MSKLDRNALTRNEIAERWDMFGPPPILKSENQEAYYELRNAFVRYFRPKDARHWSWLRELVDTQWEIHRHLRNRTAVLERYDPYWRDNQCKTVIQHLRRGKEEARELSPRLSEFEVLEEFQRRLTSRIAMAERELQELAQPNDAKDRLAFETAAKHVEKADKWLKNATQRRNTLLKILEYFSRHVATEFPAIVYREVKPDEAKKIAAPPAVPPAVAIANVTTINRTETGEPATD